MAKRFEEICHAHRVHDAECEVAFGEDVAPYRLCQQAARRLHAGRLRPMEVFHLVALNGLSPGGYTGEWRYRPNGRPEHFRWWNADVWLHRELPPLATCRDDAGMLVDYATYLWAHDVIDDDWSDEHCDQIRAADSATLLAEVRTRVALGVPRHAETYYYYLVGVAQIRAAADWVRERWAAADPWHISSLVRGSHACLPAEERVDLCLAAIERRPRMERQWECVAAQWLAEGLDRERGFDACRRYLALLPKRDLARDARSLLNVYKGPAVLDWIEHNAFDEAAVDPAEMTPDPIRPHIRHQPEAFGQLASVCGLSWARVLEWLQRGKPLIRVAVDALYACGGFEPSHMTDPIRRASRPLHEPGDRERMTAILRKCAETENEPRIRRAVGEIVGNWDRVIAGVPDERGRRR